MNIIRPVGTGSAPRFRPVNTRRRVQAVTITLAVVATIGGAAWAFGVQSSASSGPTCERAAFVPPVPDPVDVNVYNSTIVGGLAEEIAAQLEDRGFTIDKVDNDPERRKIRGTGELRYGPAAENTNLLLGLRSWQPGMVLVDDGRKGPEVDFVLGQKFDKLNDVPEAPPGIEAPGCLPTTDS